jgi:hypothetical protein
MHFGLFVGGQCHGVHPLAEKFHAHNAFWQLLMSGCLVPLCHADEKGADSATTQILVILSAKQDMSFTFNLLQTKLVTSQ